MDYISFFIQILNGVQYGLLLFLVASGLTLVFGSMGVINLAHGSFYMLGAYLAFSLSEQFGSFWIALPVGVTIAFSFGLLMEWILISRLYSRDHLYQVLLTYGLILVLEELRSLVWGDDVQTVRVPDILDSSIMLTDTLSYPIYRIWISVVCLAVAVGMYWMIQKTRIGMIVRARSEDRDMVQALGLNVRLVDRFVFAIGVALAAFAGMLAAPVSSVFPGMGNQVLIICFVVVVIGGIGSIKGAMLSALMIGLVDSFGKVVTLEILGLRVFPELSGMVVYFLMAAVLLIRPMGLFGRTHH